MAVKDETAYFPSTSLIAKEPRRHYRTRINPIHWQLRSLIGVSSKNTVYYPTGLGNLHIQEFNTVTRRSETIAFLSFSPRCLVAKSGWICCGGEVGEFVAIRLGERSSDGGDGDGADGGSGRTDVPPTMDDEEYDDFDLRMDEAVPALVTVPSRLVAKSQKFGRERVNCITIWAPPPAPAPAPTLVPTLVPPPRPGLAYQCPVAVLSNNDKHVTLVNLEDVEALDELEYPDCVNRAVLSPDGLLLAAVSDDPFLYVHERVAKEDAFSSRPRIVRSDDAPSARQQQQQRQQRQKQHEWKLLARHQLRGQDKDDRSVRRGSFAVCFSNSGKYLAVGTQYGVISVFDTSLLTEPGAAPLVACFTSSNPMTDAGAVREMSFCPGPYELLAWSEDHGAVGTADIRNNFVSRQILKLCDNNAYEPVAINQIIHINDEFLEERRRRRRSLEGAEPGSRAVVRNILSGTRLSTGDYDISSGERAQRMRESLDRYPMPLTTDETQFLEALQERRRRREMEREIERQGEQAVITENQQAAARAQRERRERMQDYLARRSATVPRERSIFGGPSVSDGTGGGGISSSSANNGGSSSNNSSSSGSGSGNGSGSRMRERDYDREDLGSATAVMSDILGSLRNLRNTREAADFDRRRVNMTQELLQAVRRSARPPFTGSRFMATPMSAGNNNNNDDSASDDDPDPFAAAAAARPPIRRPQQPPPPPRWGSSDQPMLGGDSGGGSGTVSRTLELLHAYNIGDLTEGGGVGSSGGGRGGGGSGSRRERGAFPGTIPGAMLSQTTLLDWDGGLTASRRAEEMGPLDQTDAHTAGLAWSDDGTCLYVGTEGGIFEFRVNTAARRFHPSVTMR